MAMHHPKLDAVVRKDPRYAYEAYEFLFAALAHTQQRLGRVPSTATGPERDYHVTGPELVEGVLDLARGEFGLMARTVFRQWGINRTGDIGQLVFNLVDTNLMSKRPEDSLEDFQDLCDLDKALVANYQIEVREGSGEA